MTNRLVECVPNISEGRNDAVIAQIVDAAKVEGVEILHVDKGRATNRTVITLVGSPESILEGAYQLVKAASHLIDMSAHKGEHPRMGAVDVLPFVPLQNVTMEECVELARWLGKKVANDLGIPVYLYEAAANSPERESLAYLRKGEYEGLREKLNDPKMLPDYGRPVFNAKSGAIVIGARPFLIAYNINLNTKDKKLASQIAKRIRESGYSEKLPSGDEKKVPGLFQHCRAVGWFIEEYGIAQISINLTNFRKTPLHAVFDRCCELAREMGLRVTGSEVVGLIPKESLIQAGVHYLHQQGGSAAVPENELMDIAVKSLGLAELGPFEIRSKVIEERVSSVGKFRSLSLASFADLLSSSSPTPGGGTAAAVAGALAASLCSMVAALSFSKAGAEDASKKQRFERIGLEAQAYKSALLRLADEDSLAFDKVMESMRLKPTGEAEKSEKQKKLIEAYKLAVLVPLQVVEFGHKVLDLASELLQSGLPSAFSDAAVSCELALAAIEGATYNAKINLPELAKLNAPKDTLTEINTTLDKSSKAIERLRNTVQATVTTQLGAN